MSKKKTTSQSDDQCRPASGSSDSKKSLSKNGAVIPHTDDRFAEQVAEQAQSKRPMPEIDGSRELTEAISEDAEEYDPFGHPALMIRGGYHGSMEFQVNGHRVRKKVQNEAYTLPMDTDTIKINAYQIRNKGDWNGVEEIGQMIFNAHNVILEDCWSLKRLPPMNLVNLLMVENAPNLVLFDPNSRINEITLNNCGIRFLPMKLQDSKITLSKCEDLKYIHPAIPDQNIDGLSPNEIQMAKINYLLSDKVPDIEKRLYPVEEEKIRFTNHRFETLPECFAGPEITIENCPDLKYIHPAIDPRKIKGLSPKVVCHYQMRYLFDKVQDDQMFKRWFAKVQQDLKTFTR